MAKFIGWLKDHLPTRRRLIQLYAALLYNAHLKGFISGTIYTGVGKMLCVPGLNCYSCPGAIGACPLGSLQNAVSASGQRAPVYVLGILMLYALTLGRTICGFLCPFGLLQELLHKIPTPKVPKGRITRILSWLKYVILAVFVVIIPLQYALQNLPLPAFCKYICPAGTFEGAVSLLSHPDNTGQFNMLGALFTQKFLLLLLVVLVCVFVYRGFCRFICPLGAIYGLFSRIALIGVKVELPKCTDCGRCISVCKMDIRHVGDHECIHCGECIDACPAGAISFKAGKITLHGPQTASAPAPAQKKRRRIQTAAAVFAVLLLAAVLWFCHQPTSSPDFSTPVTVTAAPSPASHEPAPDLPTGMEVGMLAPDFTVDVYGGEPFTLSDHRGKVTVINFWATWCTPCCSELPYFDLAAQKYKDQVQVIAVHSHFVTDDVQAYLDQYDYQIPFGQDPDGSVIAAFGGSTTLPMTVIIDQQGVIRYNALGSLTFEKLDALLVDAGIR